MNIIDELKNRKLFTQVIDTKEVIDAIGGGSGSGSGGGDLPSNAGIGQLMTAYNFCDTDLFESHDVEATTIYNNFVFGIPEDWESGDDEVGPSRGGLSKGGTTLRGDNSDYSFDPDHFEPVVLPMPTDLKITKNIISFRNNGKSYAFDLVDLNKKVTSGQINNKALVAAVDRHFAEAGEFDNWYNPFDAGNYNEDTGNMEPKWPIVDTDTNYYEDILKNYLKGAYPASAKAAHYFGTVGDDEGNPDDFIKRYYFDLGALGIEDHYSRVYNYDFDRIFMSDAEIDYDTYNVWPCWSVTDYVEGQSGINSFTNYSPIDPLTAAPYSLKAYSENIKGHFDWPWLLLDYLAKNDGANYQSVTGSSIYVDQAQEWLEESGLNLIIDKLNDLGNYLGWPFPVSGGLIIENYVNSLTQYYQNRQNFYITPGDNCYDLFSNKGTSLDYGTCPSNCYWEDTEAAGGHGVNSNYEYPFITDIIDPRGSDLSDMYHDWNKIYYNAGSEDGETWAKAHMLDIFNPDSDRYLAGVSTTAKPFWKSSPKKGDVVNYGIALYKFSEGDPNPGAPIVSPHENLNIYYKALYYVDVLKTDMFPWGLDFGDSDTDNVTVKAVETVIDIEKLEDMMNNQEQN